MTKEFTRGKCEDATFRLGVVANTIAWGMGMELKHIVLAACMGIMAVAGTASWLLWRAFTQRPAAPEKGSGPFLERATMPESARLRASRDSDIPDRDRTMILSEETEELPAKEETDWASILPARGRPKPGDSLELWKRPRRGDKSRSRPELKGKLEPPKTREDKIMTSALFKPGPDQVSKLDETSTVPPVGAERTISVDKPREFRALAPPRGGEEEGEADEESAAEPASGESRRPAGRSRPRRATRSTPAALYSQAPPPGLAGETAAPRIEMPGRDRHLEGAGLGGGPITQAPSPPSSSLGGGASDDGQQALTPFGK